jgi:pyrroloquinoline quinone (PQQ) biosynthesis protein C
MFANPQGYAALVPPTLLLRFDAALLAGADALAELTDAQPVDRRDALLTLLAIHDLHIAPIDRLGDRVRWQHHPAVAALKWRLESQVLAWLNGLDAEESWDLPADAVAAMRMLGHRGLVPEVYAWLAEDADHDDLVAFLTLEGGPDGGFDDLVAACQIGIQGEAKVEMAQNYWDEMGAGQLATVHTELHHRLVAALGIRTVPRHEQPIEALERSVLGTLLATNRHLQREMVGALGLLELQAGPRCRKVIKALERLDAPADAFPFYEEHAVADPRHGKDWLDHVIGSLGTDPSWAAGMVRGARWRSIINERFFSAMRDRFVRTAQAAGVPRAS